MFGVMLLLLLALIAAPAELNRAKQVVVDETIRTNADRRLLSAHSAQSPVLVDVPIVWACFNRSKEARQAVYVEQKAESGARS